MDGAHHGEFCPQEACGSVAKMNAIIREEGSGPAPVSWTG